MCIFFCNTRFHYYYSLRCSPSSWSFATSSLWCDFSYVHVSSIHVHECYSVESLQISRHPQYLRHSLSTALRTGVFPICSSPSAEVVHENFRLGCLVEMFPLQAQGKLKDSDNIILELS